MFLLSYMAKLAGVMYKVMYSKSMYVHRLRMQLSGMPSPSMHKAPESILHTTGKN